MIVPAAVDVEDDRQQLYDTFMTDVVAICSDIALAAEIGRRLRSALESDCDRRLWAAVDRQLASLLDSAARHPHQPAACRLFSYLRENQYGA